MIGPTKRNLYGPRSKPDMRSLYGRSIGSRPHTVDARLGSNRMDATLRKPVPGPLFGWVKLASYVELGLFAALLVFWLLPGFEHETFIFGLSHGIGFIALALLIWIAVLRREAPYWLLAATLTPVGPVGSVIGVGVLERREGDDGEGAG